MLGFIAVNIGVVNFKSEYLSWWFGLGAKWSNGDSFFYPTIEPESFDNKFHGVAREENVGGVFCSSKVCLPMFSVFCFLLWE